MKHYRMQRIKIQTPAGRVRLMVFRPKNAKPTVGLLWIHGGGYATGMAEMAYFTRPLALVKRYGAVVVSVDYRLSVKAPYPAALEDCYEALKWTAEHAQELGFEAQNLFVGGESAGGGLTAALCMYARDHGGPHIAFQFPLYPMLDDRDTPSSRDNHAPVWNTRRNHAAWKLYLKGLDNIPSYAAPARQTDYANLPPAYTYVGDIEPFYCETLPYIENLRKAGVPAAVDVYKDWFHAYDLFFPFTKKGKKAIMRLEQHFTDAVKQCTDTEHP